MYMIIIPYLAVRKVKITIISELTEIFVVEGTESCFELQNMLTAAGHPSIIEK